jgi:hypothetical protein
MRCHVANTAALLFGATSMEEARAATRRGRLMDLLADDLRLLDGRLGADERIRVEQYAATLENVASRTERIAEQREVAAWCERPALDGYDVSSIEGRQEAMFDLAGAAIACGMTQVVTLSLCTRGSFDAKYEGLGYTVGLHGIGHGGSDPVMGDDTAIHAFHSEMIARLCDQLDSFDNGAGGTLLDDTLIVWSSDNGTAHHSRPWHPYRAALIGGQGLRTDGRWIRFPSGTEEPRPGYAGLSDLYSTIAHAVGALPEGERHWQPDAKHMPQGILEELLA